MAPTITDITVSAVHLRTMSAAMKAADLLSELAGPGPFTLFAPSESAFDKIPRWAILQLMRPETRAQLLETMKHHIVRGKVSAADMEWLGHATTMQGQQILVDASSGVTVNGARIIMPDIECSNGVIHIIDTVIPPL